MRAAAVFPPQPRPSPSPPPPPRPRTTQPARSVSCSIAPCEGEGGRGKQGAPPHQHYVLDAAVDCGLPVRTLEIGTCSYAPSSANEPPTWPPGIPRHTLDMQNDGPAGLENLSACQGSDGSASDPCFSRPFQLRGRDLTALCQTLGTTSVPCHPAEVSVLFRSPCSTPSTPKPVHREDGAISLHKTLTSPSRSRWHDKSVPPAGFVGSWETRSDSPDWHAGTSNTKTVPPVFMGRRPIGRGRVIDLGHYLEMGDHAIWTSDASFNCDLDIRWNPRFQGDTRSRHNHDSRCDPRELAP